MTTIAGEAEVLTPLSREEAIRAFGQGDDLTVFAGGTILMPEIAMGRLRPRRALLLARAGMDGISRADGRLIIGATTPVSRLADEAPEPLAEFAKHVGDPEVRAQATIGGNLCAPPGLESPRGDLQAPLLALGARVRSTGAGGERVEAVDEFLAQGCRGRLVLELEVDEPTRGAAAGLGRPHAHSYTVLSVACAETAAGVRVAIAGAGPRSVRCPSVEQALAGGAPAVEAARRVVDDVRPQDDALASAWYRTKMLPLLVERALARLGGTESP
ncbi:MAG: FAD binding domain-containing protein [Actinomycetota bacterium]|nr:FAD binding domain-containing protein [Actinomycetota bacterium]